MLGLAHVDPRSNANISSGFFLVAMVALRRGVEDRCPSCCEPDWMAHL